MQGARMLFPLLGRKARAVIAVIVMGVLALGSPVMPQPLFNVAQPVSDVAQPVSNVARVPAMAKAAPAHCHLHQLPASTRITSPATHLCCSNSGCSCAMSTSCVDLWALAATSYQTLSSPVTTQSPPSQGLDSPNFRPPIA